MGLISSLGKRPSRLHSSMMGMRLSSMNLRVLSRTSRSSSLSSVSSSMKSTPLNLMAMPPLAGGRFAGGDEQLKVSGGEERGQSEAPGNVNHLRTPVQLVTSYSRSLLQLSVFGLGLPQHRDIVIRTLPICQKILVRLARRRRVAHHPLGPRQ